MASDFKFIWALGKLALFGFVLGLFGFVFPGTERTHIRVILCETDGCIHLGFSEIGFVLHKKGRFVENSRQLSNPPWCVKNRLCVAFGILGDIGNLGHTLILIDYFLFTIVY